MSSLTHILALVKLDSPSGHEGQVRTYIIKHLQHIGFETRVDSVGNVYGLQGSATSHPLLLCAHMDTVEPGRGVTPLVNDGIISSDGSTILGADNKAAIAAILTGVWQYKKKYKRLPQVELLFTVKEETGGGVDYIQKNWLQSTKAVIFDYAKPLGRIVTGAPYITNIAVQFKGRAAHASEPEKGANALLAFIDFASHIRLGRLDGGKTLLNIGRVQGGSGNNTIPDLVLCTGELRSLSKAFFNQHRHNIQKRAQVSAQHYGCQAFVSTNGYCPGYVHATSSLMPFLSQSLIEEGYAVGYETVFSVSDANILNSMGITTVVLSDGVEEPHTVHEHISVDTLYSLEKLVGRIVYNWAYL
ncbi:MAG: M20/M25/M40 family metallo-hydrolase [Candidatus Roizmanbacteria bacterium]|nr:M20/M25/M40 family metallo-hydrolase [Candidatus Roizmanbacteria bacterium]